METCRHLEKYDFQKILASLEELGKRWEGELQLKTFVFWLAFKPPSPGERPLLADVESFLQRETILTPMDRILCNETEFPQSRQVVVLIDDSHLVDKLDSLAFKSLGARVGDRGRV
ncbi:hypothetical protein CC2G_011012 [Coprinopsis cinerea AmutBmut pab1-1]|nr:hypothetical protein CC2G_011012 [Coprinopsis cinerea AmutBmut pab1-1]